MVNKQMKFLDNGDIRYEIVDEAARNNIQTINTVLDTKADTSNVTALDTRVTGVEEDRYKPYVTDSTSGAIASFTDGADDLPLKSLVVNIDPVQDLHGYDSPWVAGGGKNLLPKASTSNMDLHGITATINDDGSIILNGTTTSVSYIKVPLENVIASGTACAYGWFNATASDSTVQFSLRQQDSGISAGGWNTANAVNRTFTFTTGADAYYWQIQISNEATFNNYKVSPMLVVGDTAPSTYTPYENICPISGWEGMTVARTGKNLLGGEVFRDAVLAQIPNAEVGEDENGRYIRIIASSATSNKVIIDNCFKSKTRYTFFFKYKKNNTNGAANLGIFYADGGLGYFRFSETVETNTIYSGRVVTMANKTVDALRTIWASGIATIYYDEFGIFEGDVPISDFEPYNGTTVPIDWQTEAGTVYGGKLDVLSGVLTILNKHKAITDADGFGNYGDTGFTFMPNDMKSGTAQSGLCNLVPTVSRVANYGVLFGSNNSTIYFAQAKSVWGVTEPADAKQWAIDHGLELVYPLTTPIEIQLTPHEVNSLYGQNNIFADTGDSAVEYRADTKLYIERLTAPDSADMIADSNIVSGQYFMVSNALYKATANIANGGQIIVGTNCTKVSLATALNEINA